MSTPGSSNIPSSGSSSGLGSSIFTPSYDKFDNFNAAGQPILDLHSALNNIHKSFTIGSRVGNRMNLGSNGQSPSPPPCPTPNIPLWNPLTSTSNFPGSFGPPLHPPPLVNHHLGFNHPFMLAPPPRSSSRSPPSTSPIKNLSSGMPKGSGQPTATTESTAATTAAVSLAQQMSKYNQLLGVLEEMNKDVRPSYAGSKSSAERLKRGIAHARVLVREALLETERNCRN